MNAFIYTGGECDYTNISEKPAADDLVIAADSGWRHAVALRVKPSILLGDFDSLDGGNGIPDDVPDDVEILTVPAEKDFTDTQMAVDEARKRGAKHITIIGGLGGRLDHTLSCLAILEDLWEKGDRLAVIDSGHSRVRFLSSDSALIPRSGYKYLSLLAVDPVVKGVEIDGVKYPIKGAKLNRTYQFAVSNEITGNCAFIAVKKGRLLIVESRD